MRTLTSSLVVGSIVLLSFGLFVQAQSGTDGLKQSMDLKTAFAGCDVPNVHSRPMVTAMNDGVAFRVDTNGAVSMQSKTAAGYSIWQPRNEGLPLGGAQSIQVFNDGMALAVGVDGLVYMSTRESVWQWEPFGSPPVATLYVSRVNQSHVMALGADNQPYIRYRAPAGWRGWGLWNHGLPTRLRSVTALQDGQLFAVGVDGKTYSRAYVVNAWQDWQEYLDGDDARRITDVVNNHLWILRSNQRVGVAYNPTHGTSGKWNDWDGPAIDVAPWNEGHLLIVNSAGRPEKRQYAGGWLPYVLWDKGLADDVALCKITMMSEDTVYAVADDGVVYRRTSSLPWQIANEVAPPPPLDDLHLVRLDTDVHGSATFHSHNQAVVQNQHGIFVAYTKEAKPAVPHAAWGLPPFHWRLLRSVDGGRSFTIVYEELAAGTNRPVLETDADGNLYLVRSDWLNGRRDALFYRFSPIDGFSSLKVTTIPGAAADKVTSLIDHDRRQIYYAIRNMEFLQNSAQPNFFVIGFDGEIRHAALVTARHPGKPDFHYPHMRLDDNGRLYLAWTSVLHGQVDFTYRSIHYVHSDDGGLSFQTSDSATLPLPFIPGTDGPTDQIVESADFDVQTWLASFMPHKRKLHFMYLAKRVPWTEHYVRVSPASGNIDFNQPYLGTGDNSIVSQDGFFAQSGDGAELYAVSANPQRQLTVLRTSDNGDTWQAHAQGQPVLVPGGDPRDIYAVAGSRTVTDDGRIIGVYTDFCFGECAQGHNVYFFSIKAQ